MIEQINRHLKILSFYSRSVKMNFKDGQLLQYIHLEPNRTGVSKVFLNWSDRCKEHEKGRRLGKGEREQW